MTLENVAFTIPTTCRGRDWKTIEESYLYSILLKSLSNSCPDNDITLYIGYDVGDKIFDVSHLIQAMLFASGIIWQDMLFRMDSIMSK